MCSRGLATGLVPASSEKEVSSEKDTEGEAVTGLLLAETLARHELPLASCGQDEELAIPRPAADGSWGG